MGRAVATSDPAEFEYDGSVLTTQPTGNALGFGSDPAEVIFSFSRTGTGPDSFSLNSPVQDPGEISLDTDGVTCAG